MISTQEIIEGNEEFLNIDPVTIGALITGITSGGVQAYDASKRRQIEEALAKESLKNQQKIAEQLAKAKTEQDKLRLVDELLAKQRRRKNMPFYIAGGILAVGLIVGVILVLRKKK
jgi:hypothetical protein